jgi:Domain of Unknown Function (DUF1080)/FHA domain
MTKKIALVILLLVLLLTFGGSLAAKEASLPAAEAQDGWVLLFDGESTFGLLQDGSLFHAADSELTADGSNAAYIRTTSAFSDFLLKFDYRISSPSADAAVFIRTSKDPAPTENGYQIRLGNSDSSWPAGSVVHGNKAGGTSSAAGQWHAVEIDASGEHITVTIDHQKVSETKDGAARAGFIGLKAGKGARIEFRDMKLKPTDATALFNGNDLSGWKAGAEPAAAAAKPGKMKKMLHMGGGDKAKEADWSVRDHAIHGEKGPGELNSGAMYQDFILQVATRSPHHKSGSIYVRGAADKMFSGYLIRLDEDNPGAIGPNLAAPRRKIKISGSTMATIAVHDRHIAVWINGYPVSEFTDTRPEGGSTDKNAQLAAGVIALPLQSSGDAVDYAQIKLTLLAKTLGGVIGKSAPVAAAPVAVPAPTPALPAAAVQQQQAQNQAKVGKLMGDAVSSSDPAEQVKIYRQVLQLDPSNAAAASLLNTAQDKLDKKQQAEQQLAASAAQQQNEGAKNEATRQEALAKAQDAFYHRDLSTANSQLAIAERVAPDDPDVKALRQQVDALRDQAARVRYFWIGGVVLALAALGLLIFLRMRKKDGYLQIVAGIDKGKKYNLDREVTRIGAIANDGGDTNDIVVRDMERMISRFHCEIHSQNGKFYVIDCNSANGTRVDKQRIPAGKPTQLKNGMHVDLGGTVSFRFGLEKRRAKSGQ